MPAQELYYVAYLLNKLYAYNIKYHSYYMCKEELKRERDRERERERERQRERERERERAQPQ